MQVTFDPQNPAEVALIRHLFQATVAAPPTAEKANPENVESRPAADVAVDAKKRGRPAKEKVETTTPGLTTIGPNGVQLALVATNPETITTPNAHADVAAQAVPLASTLTAKDVKEKLIAYTALSDLATAKKLLLDVGKSETVTGLDQALYGAVITAIEAAIKAKK